MNYLLKCRMSLIFLTACLCSCEIADNRGSILSEQGDLISKYRPYSDLIINESRNEIYFVTSTQSDGSLSLVSLNYESKERSVLYNNSDNYADIRLIRNQESKQQLLFLIWDYTSSGQNYELHAVDLESHSAHRILTQSLNEYRMAANDDFIFFNYEYEINYILKSDYYGNINVLPIQGDVIYAVPGTNQLILRKYSDTANNYIIYDYILDKIVLNIPSYFYPERFYAHNDQIYSSDYQSVVNFLTGEVLYNTGASSQMFVDYNPIANKVVYNSVDEADPYSPRLMLRDLNGNQLQSNILYGWWIEYARILNDSNTIIYSNGEALFKISSE